MVKKLLWLNSEYIKTVSNDRLIEELKFFDLDLTNYSKKGDFKPCKTKSKYTIRIKKNLYLI